MRLALFASTPRTTAPNLVAVQDEALSVLPTVLVCPLKAGIALTAARVEMHWHGKRLIACPDLTRPISRTTLRLMGALDDAASGLIMERFLKLLARD